VVDYTKKLIANKNCLQMQHILENWVNYLGHQTLDEMITKQYEFDDFVDVPFVFATAMFLGCDISVMQVNTVTGDTWTEAIVGTNSGVSEKRMPPMLLGRKGEHYQSFLPRPKVDPWKAGIPVDKWDKDLTITASVSPLKPPTKKPRQDTVNETADVEDTVSQPGVEDNSIFTASPPQDIIETTATTVTVRDAVSLTIEGGEANEEGNRDVGSNAGEIISGETYSGRAGAEAVNSGLIPGDLRNEAPLVNKTADVEDTVSRPGVEDNSIFTAIDAPAIASPPQDIIETTATTVTVRDAVSLTIEGGEANENGNRDVGNNRALQAAGESISGESHSGPAGVTADNYMSQEFGDVLREALYVAEDEEEETSVEPSTVSKDQLKRIEKLDKMFKIQSPALRVPLKILKKNPRGGKSKPEEVLCPEDHDHKHVDEFVCHVKDLKFRMYQIDHFDLLMFESKGDKIYGKCRHRKTEGIKCKAFLVGGQTEANEKGLTWGLTGCLQHCHDVGQRRKFSFPNHQRAVAFFDKHFEPEFYIRNSRGENKYYDCRRGRCPKEGTKRTIAGIKCDAVLRVSKLFHDKKEENLLEPWVVCGNIFHYHRKEVRYERVPKTAKDEIKDKSVMKVPTDEIFRGFTIPGNGFDIDRRVPTHHFIASISRKMNPYFRLPGITSEFEGVIDILHRSFCRVFNMADFFDKDITGYLKEDALRKQLKVTVFANTMVPKLQITSGEATSDL
jgi:hypothetical protein